VGDGLSSGGAGQNPAGVGWSLRLPAAPREFDSMDIRIYVCSMRIVWDEAKNQANHGKHGLWLDDAWAVFEQPMVIAAC